MRRFIVLIFVVLVSPWAHAHPEFHQPLLMVITPDHILLRVQSSGMQMLLGSGGHTHDWDDGSKLTELTDQHARYLARTIILTLNGVALQPTLVRKHMGDAAHFSSGMSVMNVVAQFDFKFTLPPGALSDAAGKKLQIRQTVLMDANVATHYELQYTRPGDVEKTVRTLDGDVGMVIEF
ncbi:hypothetical protein [Andreprevotia chitinilytica]|uniref:hypothetical protein n=1 Tax=Andreprevotia chitinilytica TaxID=396808 RepID=UPI00054E23BD|nr:hypothetical protein [Andreprevotia chitinilytica]